MALTVPTFLVRHGRYDRQTDELTPDGQQDMLRGHAKLVEHSLGSGALILTSSATRAVQSAGLLYRNIPDSEMFMDDRLATHGNHPYQLDSLDELLHRIAQERGVEPDTYNGLVVVTHAPLIHQAVNHSLRGANEAIVHGEPYLYELGSWATTRGLMGR